MILSITKISSAALLNTLKINKDRFFLEDTDYLFIILCKIYRKDWNLLKIKTSSREDKRSNIILICLLERTSLLFSTWECRRRGSHHLCSILTRVCHLSEHVFTVRLNIHLTQEKRMAQSIFRWNAQTWILF
jgi:hypothetical protein